MKRTNSGKSKKSGASSSQCSAPIAAFEELDFDEQSSESGAKGNGLENSEEDDDGEFERDPGEDLQMDQIDVMKK